MGKYIIQILKMFVLLLLGGNLKKKIPIEVTLIL